MAREESGGDKRLVAYYTAGRMREEVGAEELRAHVAATLPEYMVPAAYVRMERMPLTANGKLDRESIAGAGSGSVRERGSMRRREGEIGEEAGGDLGRGAAGGAGGTTR